MKLVPETNKLDKRNKRTSKKKLTMTSCREIVTSLSFFQFIANLEQSVPKLTFSLIVTFYLTQTKNRTKKISNTALTLLL